MVPEDWTVARFRKTLHDKIKPRIQSFKVLRAEDNWPILKGFEVVRIPITVIPINNAIYHTLIYRKRRIITVNFFPQF